MPAVRRGRGILPAGGVTRGEKSEKFPVKNGVAGSIESLDEADGAAALFGGVANHSQPRIVMLWLPARRLSLPDVMSFCRKVF